MGISVVTLFVANDKGATSKEADPHGNWFLPIAAAAATGILVGSAMVATRFVIDQTAPASLALLRYLIITPMAHTAPRRFPTKYTIMVDRMVSTGSFHPSGLGATLWETGRGSRISFAWG